MPVEIVALELRSRQQMVGCDCFFWLSSLSMHCVRCALQTRVFPIAALTCMCGSRGAFRRASCRRVGEMVQAGVESMLSAEEARMRWPSPHQKPSIFNEVWSNAVAPTQGPSDPDSPVLEIPPRDRKLPTVYLAST